MLHGLETWHVGVGSQATFVKNEAQNHSPTDIWRLSLRPCCRWFEEGCCWFQLPSQAQTSVEQPKLAVVGPSRRACLGTHPTGCTRQKDPGTRKQTRRSRRFLVRRGDIESYTSMIEPLFTTHGMEYLRTTTTLRKTSNAITLTSLFINRPKLDQPTLHDAKMKITLSFMSILLTGAFSLSIKRQNNVPSCENGDTSDVNDFFTGSESQVLFCNPRCRMPLILGCLKCLLAKMNVI